MGLPATAPVLGDHALRVVVPLLLALSAIAATLLTRLGRLRSLRSDQLMTALLACTIAGQPLVIGPSFPGFAGNEPRLSALALLPTVFCLAAFYRVWPPRWSRPQVVAVSVAVVAASFHHIYAVAGPTSASQFVLLQSISAATIFFATVPRLGGGGPGAGESGTGGEGGPDECGPSTGVRGTRSPAG